MPVEGMRAITDYERWGPTGPIDRVPFGLQGEDVSDPELAEAMRASLMQQQPAGSSSTESNLVGHAASTCQQITTGATEEDVQVANDEAFARKLQMQDNEALQYVIHASYQMACTCTRIIRRIKWLTA